VSGGRKKRKAPRRRGRRVPYCSVCGKEVHAGMAFDDWNGSPVHRDCRKRLERR
jgi:hypothetical protein